MKQAREVDRKDLPYAETEGEWNAYLDGIMADSWGLTTEELHEFEALETEEERVRFLQLLRKPTNSDLCTLDKEWEGTLDSMEAKALGLTVEELLILRGLETEEEMRQFMKVHSKKKQ